MKKSISIGCGSFHPKEDAYSMLDESLLKIQVEHVQNSFFGYD